MSFTATIPTSRKPSARRDDPDVDRWVAMLSAELESESADNSVDVAGPFRKASNAPPINQRLEHRDHSIAPPTQSPYIEVSLEFGSGRIDDAVAELVPGAVLPLDQHLDEPIDVVADGRTIARGELLVVDGRLGVRIVELLAIWLCLFNSLGNIGMADDRPRRPTTSRQIELFEDGVNEVLETPFGTTRGKRSAQETSDIVPREPRSNRQIELLEPIVRDKPLREPTDSTIPLTKPSGRNLSRRDAESGPPSPQKSGGWTMTIWLLIGVLGLIAAGARWLKLQAVPVARGLPEEAWELLGRQSIDARSSVLLVRCGSRLLLLSSSANGLQTLAEITDPVEVDCLAGLCRSTAHDQRLTETFRSMLTRRSSKPATRETSSTAEAAGAGLADSHRLPDTIRSTTFPGLSDRVPTVSASVPPLPEARR